MAQDELVLTVSSSENNNMHLTETHEAATNLNLDSHVKKNNAKPEPDTSRGQSHSRESSGTSNLSVKFTIEREGIGGSSPSITESVSVCSSPQGLSSNSNFKGYFKPPPIPAVNKNRSKKRRSRKSVESSGQDSGALCEMSSANEDYSNTHPSEDCSLEDEGTTMDELSDEGTRLQQSKDTKSEIPDSKEHGINHNLPACVPNQNPKNNSLTHVVKKSALKNKNIKSDQVNNANIHSTYADLSLVEAQQHSCDHSLNRSLQAGTNATSGNDYCHTLISQDNPDVLDGTTSRYYKALSTVVSTSAGGAGSNDRSGHRRNDSHQPLLSDNASTSDSSSDDDAGANSSGYTRRKTKNIRCTLRDQISERIGPTGDDNNITFAPGRHTDGVNVIDVGTPGCECLNDDEEHIPGEPLKTFVAFIFLFMAWVATTTSLALTHDRVPNVRPLPDIFLDNVTYQSWGLDASEIIIMVSTWSAFLITLSHKHRFIVLRRVFLLVGLHYYYRSITMFLTVLPVADTNYLKNVCMPPSNNTTPLVIAQRVAKLLSGMGLAINGKHVYCGDYIYSGHTMTLLMGYLVIKQYSPRRWFLLHYASMVTSFAGVVTLLLARGHYSIDVIIAYWITTRIWWIFHTMANNANLKEIDGYGENQNNFLKKMWWWYIFRYFECNVPVNLPRQYDWPIPKAITSSKPVQYIYQKLKGVRRRRSSTSEPTVENVESNLHVR